MAKETNAALQKQVIYSVYVRNHTAEGTFAAVAGDLDRIRALGSSHRRAGQEGYARLPVCEPRLQKR